MILNDVQYSFVCNKHGMSINHDFCHVCNDSNDVRIINNNELKYFMKLHKCFNVKDLEKRSGFIYIINDSVGIL